MCMSCGCGEVNTNHGDLRNLTFLTFSNAADAANLSALQVLANVNAALTSFPEAAYSDSIISASSPLPPDAISCDVIKSEAPQQFTLGLAYPAMKADIGVAGDQHIDFVAKEPLEKAAWGYLKDHRGINLFHRGDTLGHGEVVESYIYRGPDWEIKSPVDEKTYLIKSGDWLLGSIWDDYAWELVCKGVLNGWSPEGTAQRVPASSKRIAQLRSV